MEVATSLDSDSRGGRAEIFHVEDDPKNPDFWGPLGGYQDPSTLAQGEDDTEAVQVKVSKLFKLADVGDAVELIQVSTYDVHHHLVMLLSLLYLLDTCVKYAFIWQ